jgi:cell division protein FtsW
MARRHRSGAGKPAPSRTAHRSGAGQPAPSRTASGPGARRGRPVEYSILYTATLCLLAGGAVMVYSASSAESLLAGSGDASFYLKRYLLFGVIGLVVLHAASRNGLAVIRAFTPVLLVSSFVLTVAVMLPGFGVTVNGATRWLGAGPLQFQPSELLKVAIVLYTAQVLAARPKSTKTLGGLVKPLLLVVGAACLLLLKQPDMGTAMVICFTVGALLVTAGTPVRLLGSIFAALAVAALLMAIVEPYRRERLTAFLDPFSDAGDSGFQAVQALTAMGSGGFFGVGLGESVQKIFYLPEAHTDMILAIIGEELGLIGVLATVVLYGMIAYAGLRAAKLARDLYAKLLAAGITSLILCQATLNFFAVMGMAPLTGVPLPFLSYGATNLIVLMGAMGLLLNVAATGGRAARGRPAKPQLEAIEGGRGRRPRDTVARQRRRA